MELGYTREKTWNEIDCNVIQLSSARILLRGKMQIIIYRLNGLPSHFCVGHFYSQNDVCGRVEIDMEYKLLEKAINLYYRLCKREKLEPDGGFNGEPTVYKVH